MASLKNEEAVETSNHMEKCSLNGEVTNNVTHNGPASERNKLEAVPEFGNEIRKEFMLRPNSVFLNHGSYGSMPRCVHERQVRYLVEMESHPDTWFRYNMYGYMKATIGRVAEFMGIRMEDTFMLQNVTKAANTVLKTFPFHSGDAVLVNSLTYGAVNVAARATTAASLNGAQTLSLDINFPINSEDEVVQKYEDFLKQHPEVKLVIVDHITSPTAVVMPVKRIVHVCHAHGAVVFVDAAHVPGQLRPDIQDIDADFYAGNLHKWVFCPRSAAIIWRNPSRQHAWFRPLVTSAFEHRGLHEAFGYEGTKDDIPYICAANGIEYINRVGGLEKINEYNSTLLYKGVTYLEEKWGTKRLQVPDSMHSLYQCIVALPFIPGFSDFKETPAVTQVFMGKNLELQKLLLDKFDVQVAVVYVGQELMVRVSVSIYNTMDDIIRLADAVLALTKTEA